MEPTPDQKKNTPLFLKLKILFSDECVVYWTLFSDSKLRSLLLKQKVIYFMPDKPEPWLIRLKKYSVPVVLAVGWEEIRNFSCKIHPRVSINLNIRAISNGHRTLNHLTMSQRPRYWSPFPVSSYSPDTSVCTNICLPWQHTPGQGCKGSLDRHVENYREMLGQKSINTCEKQVSCNTRQMRRSCGEKRVWRTFTPHSQQNLK